jgi:hypothetical protein
MQKFEYRTPRFSVDLPVRFTVEDTTLIGRCTEISQDGMRLELRHPLPADACGVVRMSYQEWNLELNVRVAHVGATHGGLEFIYESDRERIAVARLIASLAAAQNRPGPMLVN